MLDALTSQRIVLGAILRDHSINPVAVVDAVPITFFSDPILRTIYTEWLSSPVTLLQRLTSLGAEYVKSYTSILTSDCVTFSSLKDYFIKIVHSELSRRTIDEIIANLATLRDKTEISTDDIYNAVTRVLAQYTIGVSYSSYTLPDIFAEYLKKPQQRKAGVPYGAMLKYIDGFYPGDYWIIGARPSMGKTTLSFDLAFRLASSSIPSYYLSLEMNRYALLERAIARIERCSIGELRTTKKKEELASILHDKLNVPLYISDTTLLSAETLELPFIDASIKECSIIFIDYIQLLHSSHKTKERYIEIAAISSQLKELAKRYNMTVVALSQLNRLSEHRADKRPILADLRESGSLEQDADVVILLHRPDKYGITSYEDGRSTANTVNVIVAKNRQGETGDFILHYDPQYFSVNSYVELQSW